MVFGLGVEDTSKTSMVTARMLPMQVFMLSSQGMRCVQRMRLITARNTCTADVCMHRYINTQWLCLFACFFGPAAVHVEYL